MAIREQYVFSNPSDNPADITITEPTSGNLLIAWGSERNGTPHADFVLSGITGWTKAFGVDFDLENATFRYTLAVWYKIAEASEGTSLSLDNGTNFDIVLGFQEFSLDVGETEFTFLEFGSDSDSGPSSPQSTGNTPSISGDQFLVIPIVGYKYSGTDYPTTSSWATAGGDILSAVVANNEMRLGSGHITDTTTGVRSDSVTFNGTIITIITGILVFDLGAASSSSSSSSLSSSSSSSSSSLSSSSLSLSSSSSSSSSSLSSSSSSSSLSSSSSSSSTSSSSSSSSSSLSSSSSSSSSSLSSSSSSLSSSSSSSSTSSSSSSSSSSLSSFSSSSSISSSSASAGTVTWGHHTGVEEDYDEDFVGNWSLENVTVSGSGDSETLTFACPSAAAISEGWLLGALEAAKIDLNKYDGLVSGPQLSIEYRTATTKVGLDITLWNTYTGISFTSLGWVQVRLYTGLDVHPAGGSEGATGDPDTHSAFLDITLPPSGTNRILAMAVMWEDSDTGSYVESLQLSGGGITPIDATIHQIQVVEGQVAPGGRIDRIEIFALYEDELPDGGNYTLTTQVTSWNESTVQPFLGGVIFENMHQHAPLVSDTVEYNRGTGELEFFHTANVPSGGHSGRHLIPHLIMNSQGYDDEPPSGALYIANSDGQIDVVNGGIPQPFAVIGFTYKSVPSLPTSAAYTWSHTLSSGTNIVRHLIAAQVWDEEECEELLELDEDEKVITISSIIRSLQETELLLSLELEVLTELLLVLELELDSKVTSLSTVGSSHSSSSQT